MVDLSFLEAGKGDTGKGDDVEKMNRPAPSGMPMTVDQNLTLIINDFNEKLRELARFVDEIEVRDQASLAEGVELEGKIKKLSSMTEAAAKVHLDPLYTAWKEKRNLVTATLAPLGGILKRIAKKNQDCTRRLEYERLEAERKAKAEAARIQAEIDAEYRKQQAAEKKAAQAEKREEVKIPKIVIDAPSVPKTIGVKTEHGTLKSERVLEHKIVDYTSMEVLKVVWAYAPKDYKTTVDKAFKRALKAGALGAGKGQGYVIEEIIKAKHRKR